MHLKQIYLLYINQDKIIKILLIDDPDYFLIRKEIILIFIILFKIKWKITLYSETDDYIDLITFFKLTTKNKNLKKKIKFKY